MNRQIRTASLLALTALLTLGLAGPAFGHAKLMQAVPRASQALHRMPRTVVLHRVPKYHYEYAVVNHRRVIVEPGTRRVVKVIE